jgi:hypothetical protein
MGKLREIVDTMMEGPKGKRGERYWLQTLVHRH